MTPSEPAKLSLDRNVLLEGQAVKTVRVEEIEAPSVLVRPHRSAKRELRDARRLKTAAEAIAGLNHDVELYGFTKGQFSLLDLLTACLNITGPARLVLSTWTAARHEIQAMERLLRSGQMESMRWLIDFTFSRRDPEAAHQIRLAFGLESVRVAQNHSKFALFTNDAWSLVLRTSMNLNMNPRFEDFTLAHDPQLAAFLHALIDDIWTRQKRSLADGPQADMRRYFVDEM